MRFLASTATQFSCVVNLWYTEELRQELKNIQNLCHKAEESWSTEDWDKVRDARR